MSLYQKNIQAYLQRYPQEVQNVQLYQTHKSINLIKTKNNNIQMWQNGVMVDSSEPGFYYPVEQVNFSPKIGILMGLGLGKRLIEVIDENQKRKTPLSVLVVIEPSYERFLKACQVVDLSGLFRQPNVMWFIGKPVSKVYDELYTIFFDLFLSRNRNNIFFFKHPSLTKIDTNYYESIQREIKQASTLMFTSFGSQEDCFLGIYNTIRNIHNVNKTPGFNKMEGKLKGLPAVVVATGPSLEKSIPKLKKVKDKCVIFAADASLKILLKHGIVPHFVATLERDDQTVNFFNNLEPFENMPYMVYFPLSPKATVDAYPGPKFVTYRNYNYFDYFEKESPKGVIKCGHSVAHMCAKLATVAGCSRIILIGQDLAYDPEKLKTHAEGTHHGKGFKNKEELAKFFIDSKFGKLHEVKGKNDKLFYTHDIFLYFAREFISEQKDSGNIIYNATESGINIPEVPWVDFDKISQTFTNKLDVYNQIKENHTLNEKDINIEELLTELTKFKRELEKDSKKLKEIKTQKPKKIRSLLRKMDQRRIDYYYPNKLVCGFIIESDSKLLLGLENDFNLLSMEKEEELFKMLDLTIKWFDEAARIAKECIENIQNGQKD